MTTVAEPSTPPQSLLLTGAATGAAVELAVSVVYVLIRIGFDLASNHTVPVGATALPAPDSADRIFGVLVIGGLLTLAPSILAGGLFGALLAVVVKTAGHRLNLLGAWLAGSVLAYVVAMIVNAMVILRTRTEPLRFSEWAPLLGYPSIIFVVIFGGLGVWLHLTWTREHTMAPQPEPLAADA